MLKKFDKILVGLLPEKETALLAVSGGRDSMCMAQLFMESGRDFAIAHCNFHLRGEESDSDEVLVREWAEQNHVTLHVAQFDTEQYASEHSVSIEMAARELRYDWFAELCRRHGYYAVSVAHNSNDNAETLILNLLRGTGLKGISGMKEISEVPVSRQELEGVRLIRPLLQFSRTDIDNFVQKSGIRYHDDRTNAETLYKRNCIRHKVLPVFESMNPSFLSTFAREMRIFAQENAVADEFFAAARVRVNAVVHPGECLRINLDALHEEKHCEYILFRLLEPYGFKGRLLDPVVRYVSDDEVVPGRVFEAPGYRVITAPGRLSVVPVNVDVPYDESVQVTGESTYKIGIDEITVSCSPVIGNAVKEAIRLASEGVLVTDSLALTFPFNVRRWCEGDWMRPIGVHGRKKLSDMFGDLKVGIDEKRRALVIVREEDEKTAGSHVAAVCGYASGRFYCRVDEAVALSSKSCSMIKISLLNG